jgi:hypothetical protein
MARSPGVRSNVLCFRRQVASRFGSLPLLLADNFCLLLGLLE